VIGPWQVMQQVMQQVTRQKLPGSQQSKLD
jgi:hypothetical protein